MEKVIRELRKREELTQEKLAQRLNVSVQTVRRWEARTNKPSPMALKLLKELFPDFGKS